MTERDTENYTQEELRRPRSAPRRRGVIGRVLGLVLLLAVVLGVVAFTAYRDMNSFDSLRRMLSYNKNQPAEKGTGEEYSFDSDRSNVFELLGDKLLVVSTTRMTLVDKKQGQLFSEGVKITHPAIVRGGDLAAVYDVGGQALYLVSEKGTVRDLSGKAEGSILSASLSGSGDLTLTTSKSGYKSAVTVYDASFTPRFTFNSSDRYVADACLFADGKHLAAVTLGEADGAFASTLTIYSLTSEMPLATNTLTGSLVLSLQNLGGTVCALQDDRLTTFAADGSLTGNCRFDYPYLRGQSLRGADFAAVLLSRYRSGSALQLVTVDNEGNVLGTLNERREVLDISASGKYVAALYGDSLTVFTSDMKEYATLTGTNYAKHVIMRPDGTAVLIGASGAWMYIP